VKSTKKKEKHLQERGSHGAEVWRGVYKGKNNLLKTVEPPHSGKKLHVQGKGRQADHIIRRQVSLSGKEKGKSRKSHLRFSRKKGDTKGDVKVHQEARPSVR